MLRYGLLPDDISNFVTVNNILAYKDTEKPDPLWQNNLKSRYPEQIDLKFMTEKYYLFSDPKNKIDARRLKKIEKIFDVDLDRTSQQIKKLECSGYQEELLDLYSVEIEQLFYSESSV